MNFIIALGTKDVPMELKYCERCGGLWLRPQGGEGVYCPGCSVRLAELPVPKRRRSFKPRPPQGEDLHGQIQIEILLGVAEMGVEG
jgi:DNA-directed RNA polymerase subunit RPC12/RpoP